MLWIGNQDASLGQARRYRGSDDRLYVANGLLRLTRPNDGDGTNEDHTAAACSPTRAMLLSGTDNHIAGVGVLSEQKGRLIDLPGTGRTERRDFAEFDLKRWDAPGHEGYLNYRVAALPEILQDNAYHTLLSGKWHLGLKPDYLPDKRGFDRSFALLPGCSNHYGWEPQFGDDMIRHFERIPPLYAEDGKKVEM